jgi:transposase
MAMELSQKDWKLAFAQAFEKPRIRNVRAGDLTSLEIEIQTTLTRFDLGPETPVYSCFEAGRDGFWIHRELQRRGWNNIVVDPASIEVDRRARTRKTDRLDVQKLISRLVRWAGGEKGVWKVVAVPDAEQEDQRRLHRERKRLIKERTGHLARIRSLLATQGPAPEKLNENCLRHVSFNGAPMPKRLTAELEREWKRLELVNEQIREVEKAMRTEAKEDTESMEKVRRVKSPTRNRSGVQSRGRDGVLWVAEI